MNDDLIWIDNVSVTTLDLGDTIPHEGGMVGVMAVTDLGETIQVIAVDDYDDTITIEFNADDRIDLYAYKDEEVMI